MKTNRIIYLFALISLSLSACFGTQEDAIEIEMATAEESVTILSNQQFTASEMSLTSFEKKAFTSTVAANGRVFLAPEDQVAINTFISGVVKKIDLLPGEKVSKGQALFVLEDPKILDIQQEYLQTKAEFDYLKGDYERQLALSKENVNSQKDFKKAEADYLRLEVSLASLRKKLSLIGINPTKLQAENIRSVISIRSPIDGYVSQVHIHRGAHLSTGETAIELVNADNLLLKLNVFEKDLHTLSVGQEIRFQTIEMDQATYAGEILFVNKFIDPETGIADVIGELSDSKLSSTLAAGMFIEAEVHSAADSLPSLPEEAIVEIDGAFYVLRLIKNDDGGFRFDQQEVQIGKKGNGFVAIQNSQEFEPNTRFLSKGAFNLILE
jgi:cobalt-zinc-cadmium efflux system membrane fusion protein